MFDQDFENTRKTHEYLQLFSDDEICQIYCKTEGICYKCLKSVELSKFMSDGNRSWFIIDPKHKSVFTKNGYDLHLLNPVCSECFDELSLKRDYVNW